ncbi:MAG: HAD family hydrolase [Clostridiales bacterium]|nr:HAD family hydrolase [Clostridiales bacterium]
MQAKYKNYVFDLYGTLFDVWTDETDPSFREAVSKFYSGNGAEYGPDEFINEYLRLCGEAQSADPDPYFELELRDVFGKLYSLKGVDADARLVAETAVYFRKASTKKLELYPWVRPVFGMIKRAGGRIFLLSNAQACFTMPELAEKGIAGDFDGIVISSDVSAKKPSPKIMLALLDRFELNAEDCLMTGNDQHTDVAIARSFSMDSFYIKTATSGEYDPLLKADIELLNEDYTKIPGLIGLKDYV